MTSPLLSARQGDALVLTLDRPERRNALSPDLVEALLAAVAEPNGARAIVLTGAGDHFCAGGDLAGGMTGDAGFLAQHQQRGRYADLLLALLRSPVPVIAAVNGDALGGGLGLVAASHLAVAAAGARLGTPEIGVGLFPMMIHPLLARSLPRKVLCEMELTGGKISAEDALGWGLVNRVLPREEVLAGALALAQGVAARSPAIVGLGLRAAEAVADLPVDRAVAHMHTQLTLNLLTEDAAEGIAAFLGRRSPQWRGR